MIDNELRQQYRQAVDDTKQIKTMVIFRRVIKI